MVEGGYGRCQLIPARFCQFQTIQQRQRPFREPQQALFQGRLHFFRGGWTEPAQIEITDGDEVISLKVFPLTGRVRTYDEPLKALELEDQEGREEGDL